jgi:hypothetical protein
VIGITRHARGLLVALAVLALSAGAALAGHADPSTGSMPDAARPGLDRATEASGKTVPVAAPAAGADQDEDAADAQDESTDTNEAPAAAPAEHPDNHGATVSAAAQTATPAGFDNHGQYVRSIATANHGQQVSASHANPASKGTKPSH